EYLISLSGSASDSRCCTLETSRSMLSCFAAVSPTGLLRTHRMAAPENQSAVFGRPCYHLPGNGVLAGHAGGTMTRDGGARMAVVAAAAIAAAVSAPTAMRAQTQGQRPIRQVTFTRDIAPILQRSCQQCHTPEGGAPMSLVTYDDVRPFARAIKRRTSLGPHAGV